MELGGTGELVLNGANNTYTGGTTIDAGTLDVAAAGAAGSGTITFANQAANGDATLQIDAAALTGTGASTFAFANTIAGATSTNQVIDLTSLAYAQGSTSATLTGTSLMVANGSSSVTLQLASTQAKSSFVTASDGHGGTLVYDPPATPSFAQTDLGTTAPGGGSGDAAASVAQTPAVETSWIALAMEALGGLGENSHPTTQVQAPWPSQPLRPDIATHIAAALHHT